MIQLNLEQATAEISKWRKSKITNRDPMPAHLWQAAIDLSKTYDYKIVASQLGISVSDLKKKLGLPAKPRKSKANSNITFAQLPQKNNIPTGPCIELVTQSGIQIKIYS